MSYPKYQTTPRATTMARGAIEHYLLKYKSQESASLPVVKLREVLTYACHPFQKICKLMGRALTLLWKMAVDVLQSREVVAMPQMLHVVKKMAVTGGYDSVHREIMPFWTEVDVNEMFPVILAKLGSVGESTQEKQAGCRKASKRLGTWPTPSS